MTRGCALDFSICGIIVEPWMVFPRGGGRRMKTPDFGVTRWNKLCHTLSGICHSAQCQFLYIPLLITVPSALFVLALSDVGTFGNAITKVIGYAPDHINYWRFGVFFLLQYLVCLAPQLLKLVDKCSVPACCLSRDDLVAVIGALGTVVDHKNSRFLAAARGFNGKTLDGNTVFMTITKPDQQIALLVDAIGGIFEYLKQGGVDFRVGLAIVGEGENGKPQPKDWFAFYPRHEPPKTSMKVLASPSSAIGSALKCGKMVIVEDMQKALKKQSPGGQRCVRGSLQEDENASILALPVLCPNTRKPIYVISILGKAAGCLTKKEKELYQWVLDLFVTRIILEHHLLLMKEACHERQDAG